MEVLIRNRLLRGDIHNRRTVRVAAAAPIRVEEHALVIPREERVGMRALGEPRGIVTAQRLRLYSESEISALFEQAGYRDVRIWEDLLARVAGEATEMYVSAVSVTDRRSE